MVDTVSSSASNRATELTSQSQDGPILKANSSDVGWEYAIKNDPLNPNKLKCLLCNKVVSGGVYRMKQHITNIKGNVGGCKKSMIEDRAKCLKTIEDAQNKKKQKVQAEKQVREEVVIVEEYEMEDDGSQKMRRKRPKFLGPMGRFTSEIDPDCSISKKTQNINSSIFKDRTHKVHQDVSSWIYEAGIPFYDVEHDSFKKAVEAIVRPGVARFVTVFLTLQSLMEKKNELRSMITSVE